MGKIREKIANYLSERRVMQYNNDGRLRVIQGRYKDAIEYFNEALRIDPENIIAWGFKGVALSELGKHEEAGKCYEELDKCYEKIMNIALKEFQKTIKLTK